MPNEDNDTIAVEVIPARPLRCPLCGGTVNILEEEPVSPLDFFGEGDGQERTATKYTYDCPACPPLYQGVAIVAWG